MLEKSLEVLLVGHNSFRQELELPPLSQPQGKQQYIKYQQRAKCDGAVGKKLYQTALVKPAINCRQEIDWNAHHYSANVHRQNLVCNLCFPEVSLTARRYWNWNFSLRLREPLWRKHSQFLWICRAHTAPAPIRMWLISAAPSTPIMSVPACFGLSQPPIQVGGAEPHPTVSAPCKCSSPGGVKSPSGCHRGLLRHFKALWRTPPWPQAIWTAPFLTHLQEKVPISRKLHSELAQSPV